MANTPSQEDFDEAAYLGANADVAAAVAAGQFRSGWHHFDLFGRREGRFAASLGTRADAPGRAERTAAENPLLRFEQRPPSAQTAVDAFRGRWASDLSPLIGVTGTGTHRLFTDDPRPQQAASVLGEGGRLSGFSVLELGPLEGAHSYLLEGLGAASVTAVEANVEAYLKCLVVKEVLGLRRSRFLLGDMIEHLETDDSRYDLVFCSGVLYHMADPLRTIRLISGVADRCFVWTHYYDGARRAAQFTPVPHAEAGFGATYWSHAYGDRSSQFWGGNKPGASWLERDALLGAFRHFGLSEQTVVHDDPSHPNGSTITFTASRPARARTRA